LRASKSSGVAMRPMTAKGVATAIKRADVLRVVVVVVVVV
jgi:hypothetical protein